MLKLKEIFDYFVVYRGFDQNGEGKRLFP